MYQDHIFLGSKQLKQPVIAVAFFPVAVDDQHPEDIHDIANDAKSHVERFEEDPREIFVDVIRAISVDPTEAKKYFCDKGDYYDHREGKRLSNSKRRASLSYRKSLFIQHNLGISRQNK